MANAVFDCNSGSQFGQKEMIKSAEGAKKEKKKKCPKTGKKICKCKK